MFLDSNHMIVYFCTKIIYLLKYRFAQYNEKYTFNKETEQFKNLHQTAHYCTV